MDLKVKDYVRCTGSIGIKRVIEVIKDLKTLEPHAFKDEKGIIIDEKYILKHSPSIIDVIEVGDYVNGYKVCVDWVKTELIINQYDEGWKSLKDVEIKSIVTHEQLEAISYKIK